MESSLHRELKEQYGPESGGRLEVTVQGFRIDAVTADGELVEVQSGALGPLQAKLRRLLPEHRVRVIKPVVLCRRVVRRAHRDGDDLSRRLSPKRGAVGDVFDDFVGLATLFPHANLVIEVLAVDIDELRLPRRRRPGFTVLDRRLNAVVDSVSLRDRHDLWALLPDNLPDSFTTRDLAGHLARPLALAQRVAYCLRSAGLVTTEHKRGNGRIYEIATGARCRTIAAEQSEQAYRTIANR